MSEVPTLNESGVPGYEFYGWFAIFAPTATPLPVLQRLRQELAWALAQDDVRLRLAVMGAGPLAADGLDMAGLWRAEHVRYRQLLADMAPVPDAP